MAVLGKVTSSAPILCRCTTKHPKASSLVGQAAEATRRRQQQHHQQSPANQQQSTLLGGRTFATSASSNSSHKRGRTSTSRLGERESNARTHRQEVRWASTGLASAAATRIEPCCFSVTHLLKESKLNTFSPCSSPFCRDFDWGSHRWKPVSKTFPCIHLTTSNPKEPIHHPGRQQERFRVRDQEGLLPGETPGAS